MLTNKDSIISLYRMFLYSRPHYSSIYVRGCVDAPQTAQEIIAEMRLLNSLP